MCTVDRYLRLAVCSSVVVTLWRTFTMCLAWSAFHVATIFASWVRASRSRHEVSSSLFRVLIYFWIRHVRFEPKLARGRCHLWFPEKLRFSALPDRIARCWWCSSTRVPLQWQKYTTVRHLTSSRGRLGWWSRVGNVAIEIAEAWMNVCCIWTWNK